MPTKRLVFGPVVAALVATGACTVKNVEVHGSYDGAGIRDSAHPVMAEMFNLAFKAVKLPAGSVTSGDYVAVYRLSSGKTEDQWWCYLAEDWMVDKIRTAGATPVERNASAINLLEREDEYFEPPNPTAPGRALSPSGRAREAELTPYRATRALAYRVVAADLWFDHFNAYHGRQEPTVRANAKVVMNLRTLDVQTGEILWAGTAHGTARKTIKISRVIGWLGIHDWEDWDDWDDFPPGWWHWRWDGDDDTIAEPAPEGDESAEEPAEGDESAEEPAGPAESLFWNW